MIQKWYNTNAAKMADMTEVTDEMIRSLSNGQVSTVPDEDNYENTIDDEKIFGKLLFGEDRKNKEESMKMGHIELGIPVVNVQYTFGRKPVLAKSLGLTMKEMESVIYYAKWIVTDPGNTNLSYKQILDEKKYREAQDAYGDGFAAMAGAEAVEFLLKKEDVKDREYMILHCIPVVPLCMRYIHFEIQDNAEECPCNKEHYSPATLNRLYNRLIIRCNRLSSLLQRKLPDIIERNEKRMLQEYVDALINNGARGRLATVFGNIPCESLEELHTVITSLKKETHNRPKEGIDMDKYMAALKAYEDYEDEYFPEGTELSVDDPINIRLDELEAEVAETMRPFVREYIRLNYSRYAGFEDEIFHYATADPVSVYVDWKANVEYGNVDEKNMKPALQKGITKQIDMFIKKQLKWRMRQGDRAQAV